MNLWEPMATQWLQENAGLYQFSDLVRRFNQVAHLKGWQTRTPKAVESKLIREKLPLKCLDGDMCLKYWADALGIASTRIYHWKKRGLPVKRRGTLTRIRAKDVEAFLLANPANAVGIEDWRLAGIFGDAIAAQIVEARPQRLSGVARPVVNLDTGMTYPSTAVASKAYYVHPDSIGYAARHGTRSAGYRWVYLDEMRKEA